MKVEDRNRHELLEEISHLRQRIRDLERSEAERRQLEKRLKDIADNASSWFWEVDLSGKFTYTSKYVEEIIGYTPEELLRMHFFELLDPEDREVRKKAVFEVFAGRRPFHDYTSRMLHKDGRTVWVSTSGVPVFDDLGNPIGYRGVDTDVTARMEMEQALRESEAKHRLLLDAIQFPVLALREDMSILYCNEAYASFVGKSVEEVEGEDLFSLAPVPRDTQSYAIYLEVMHTGRAQEVEGACGERYLRARIYRTPWGLLSVGEEITERKQAEDALRESEERFRALAEGTSELIWETDVNGFYIYVSPKLEEILGYGHEEAIGRALYDFTVPDEAPRVAAEFERHAKARASFSGLAYCNVHRDGRLVWLETSGVPIIDEKGELQGYRGVTRDITEHKTAEEALEKWIHDLGERVKELTCLSRISQLMAGGGKSLDETLRMSAELIRDAWQHNEIACARITCCGKQFATTNWRETEWSQYAHIVVEGESVGDVQVCYLEERPEADEGPFLKEERDLIQMLADLLGGFIGRRQAEEALRESEERFRALTESTSDWVWEVDFRGVYTYASPKVRDLLGYEPHEVIGRTPFDLMLPKVAERVREEYAAIGEERRPFEQLEKWAMHKDGRLVLLETSGVPILDKNGELIGYRGIDRDVTERKEIEEALQERQRELQMILDSVPVFIYYKDREGRFLRANRALIEATGIPGEEWVRKCNADLFPAQAEAYDRDDREVIEAGRAKRGIVEQYDFPLGKGWVRTDKTPVRDRLGRVIGLIGLAVDITELKRAEQALQVYSERLEEMVELRTRELEKAQEELIRKEKLAVLGQLAGAVGHELRGPLGVISNAVYLLQSKLGDSDETVQRNLERIVREVNASVGIISDLLDFSRSKPGKREQVAVSALVAEVWERCPPPENVETETNIDPDLPLLFVDPRQIGQVLNNLVSNAYQAMPDGGTLTIGGKKEAGHIHLSVRDTGCGISSENMEKLFQPLFTTKERGIGLGLMVTQTLTEANGGTISVESEEGKGSTFRIILPVATDAELPRRSRALSLH